MNTKREQRIQEVVLKQLGFAASRVLTEADFDLMLCGEAGTSLGLHSDQVHTALESHAPFILGLQPPAAAIIDALSDVRSAVDLFLLLDIQYGNLSDAVLASGLRQVVTSGAVTAAISADEKQGAPEYPAARLFRSLRHHVEPRGLATHIRMDANLCITSVPTFRSVKKAILEEFGLALTADDLLSLASIATGCCRVADLLLLVTRKLSPSDTATEISRLQISQREIETAIAAHMASTGRLVSDIRLSVTNGTFVATMSEHATMETMSACDPTTTEERKA
jgi:hypothetical protein